jgi:hypothetical protein
MQSDQDRWFSLVLRRECSAEATSKLRDRRSSVCDLLVIAHGGRVQVAACAWSGLRLWSWHSVGDDGTSSSGFLLALLPRCVGVVSCCVRYLCALFVCGGFRFGA